MVLSSCGFSPFKTAFAAPYYPDLPDWFLPLSPNARIRSASGSNSYVPWEIASSSTFSDLVPVPPGTYYVECGLQDIFSTGTTAYEFSGAFGYFSLDGASGRFPVFPYAVRLRIRDPSSDWYSWLDADMHFLDTQVFFTAEYDGSAPSGIIVEGVYLFFGEPSEGDWTRPADSDYTGVPSIPYVSDYDLVYSSLRVKPIDLPTADEGFQNSVTGSLDDINDDINEGFDSIQGEISSGSHEVVDAVDGVKDSVDSVGDDIVQWGQNIVTGITNGVTNIQETIVEQTETLGNFILDGLKSLFIPSEGYFKELFDDLNEFFSDVFGFLYFPIEHVISWFNRLLTLPENEPSIAIPELAYEDTVLIEAQTYTFDFLDDEPFSTVHDYYLLAMDAAMIMGFVHLLQRKYEEVMKN